MDVPSHPIRVLLVADPDFGVPSAENLGTATSPFETEIATTVTEALDALSGDDFDCVVSTYALPESNGLALFRDIRNLDPGLPFVLYTEDGPEAVAEEAATAGVTALVQRRPDTDEDGLLTTRIVNAVAERRAENRREQLDRLRTMRREMNQRLIRARSRQEISEEICETMAAESPFDAVWVGETVESGRELRPRTSGNCQSIQISETNPDAEQIASEGGLVQNAIETGTIEVRTDGVDPGGPWETAASKQGFEAMAAVPLATDTSTYGVLVLYSDTQWPFEGAPRELLSELGTDIGHAIHAATIQERLREERDRRTALFENAPTPIAASRPAEDDTHRFTDVNSAFEGVFGYPREDLIGEPVNKVLIPEDEIETHVERKERAESGESITGEVTRLTKAGPREFLFQLIPYGADEAGIEGSYVWYTDISAQKERERALEQARDEYEELINGMNDSVWVISQEGQFITANDTAVETLGYSEAELREMSPQDLDVGMSDQEIAALIEGMPDDEQQVFETIHRTKSGQEIPVEISSSLITYEGEQAILSVARDITERKARENRLERFASVVSHDLQNPLMVAEGRLELLAVDCESDHLEPIEQSLTRMNDLIEDLLELARRGDTVGEKQSVDIETVVKQSWDTIETREASIEVTTHKAIAADRSRLRQLFENLLGNAVEHAGPTVTVTVGDLEDGFYVADDGPGIPPPERESIAEIGYSTAAGGTGLGLSIVEQVTNAHGWTLTVTESDFGGARFEVRGVDVNQF
ncbi:multi-sensor signal transduction histidine kinase [Halodesulfurarchaeum formicicum]|uniref:histidine kinase n=1 Tax=Halodesulfurarchaeum formicicum TaxID=1873524 RepID=A0A1D8S4L7_9EURY|nr:PAS domain S-box protein [Halodesulfurarchaeum formicicum]AOW80296.1 multi-sensor signal transduction histidine kinase [Halodesulfurarchaeum formicicum]